jgi:hypothetical protein
MTRTAVLLLATSLLAPAALTAQQQPTTAVSVNARVGYDMEFDALVTGASLRVPVLRFPFELQGAFDFTFLDGLTDRQLALDLLYRAGAGLFLGGGVIFRNSIYVEDAAGPRETRTGYSLVLGLGGAPSRRGRVLTGLEVRWMWVGDFSPQTIVAQVGIPLLRF